MTDVERRAAAKQFAEYWKGKGYEKGESQPFWLSLLQKVYGVESPEQYISFEEQVHIDHTSFVDGHIRATHVLVEQKSLNKSLSAPIRQADGSYLTPFQQAKRYSAELPRSEHPRWIVTCNFKEFYIYDMEQPSSDPEIVLLENLERDYYRLNFLVDANDENIYSETQVSLRAGELVGIIYDALKKKYTNPESPRSLKSLNALCVRLVFCLYAEDAGIFGARNMFHDYMQAHRSEDRRALINLFHVLDQKPEERDPYLDADLAAFPYVNGGLFADEDIEIPRLGDEVIDLIINDASAGFNWADISPTIFGAVFESTLNPATRRAGGMHYTSIENIHKVIDPLFLDDLRAEFEQIKSISVIRTKDQKLRAFQQKLASLKFLDPACGSGNFLTETFLSLRRIENEVISILIAMKEKGLAQITMRDTFHFPIKVSISQFFGIEINDFAVAVAKTALWIAESQMMIETSIIENMDLEFFPLKTNATIIEGNALQLDWKTVIPSSELNYIMGNPPFVGEARKTPEQSNDMQQIFGKGAPETKLDYVICWYKKAADYMKGTRILAAFVSTNSICQGESVPTLWRSLFDQGIAIFFAHRSFKWKNEANEIAQVYCVIVGFSYSKIQIKTLYVEGVSKNASHINAYLLDADDIWLQTRINRPINGLPKMTKGSEPTDGGNLFLSSEEKDEIINRYPVLERYIRPFIGGKEFTSNKYGEYTRYCFWFKDGNSLDYSDIPEIRQRLADIRRKRLNSSAERIRVMADYPALFCQERQPKNDYLLFPRHTTSERQYIPFGFIEKEVIVGDSCTISEHASLYEFGLLSSNVHMAWTKTVCGRLGDEYRYSQLVYNNFPLPSPSDLQKARVEQTAQGILDARALHPDYSLAKLYDRFSMPGDLRTAHQENDRAVWEAYGKAWTITSENECVAELMKMYQKLTEK
jgi:hypothetical protein